MKKLFLFLVVLGFCLQVSAQNNLDSLWGVWSDKNVSDSARLNALWKYTAKGVLRKKPDSALVLANIHYRLADKTDSDYFRAVALHIKAQAHSKKGDYNLSVDYYNQALALREQIGDSAGVSMTLNNLGSVYKKLGNFKLAISSLERSFSIDSIQKNKGEGAKSLGNLANVYNVTGEYDKAIEYAEKSIELKKEVGNERGVANSLHALGMIYNNQGNIGRSIEYYSKALAKHEELGNMRNAWKSMNNLGLVYKSLGDYEKAVEMAHKTLRITEELKDKGGITASLNNLGIAYERLGELDKAIEIQHRAIALKKKMGNKSSLATSYHNLGEYKLDKNEFDSAMFYLNMALAIREEVDDPRGKAVTLNSLGMAYLAQSDFDKAAKLAEKALKISEDLGLLNQIRESARTLHKTNKHFGNSQDALRYFELHIQMRDSLDNEDNQRQLIRYEYKYEYEKEALTDSLQFVKREAVLEEKTEKQKLGLFAAGSGLILLLTLAFAIYNGKKKSDELLLNILPAETAQELKDKGSADAKLIDEVTVLFTDFKGFTAMSEQLSPKDLVQDLNVCFSEFDRIMERHGIEKIKTIGDAYMAAGGLPTPNKTHPQDVVKAALEMAEVVEKGKAKKISEGNPFFEIRIGVHTGPVVAGIVGVKKFQYDIWGDTVNTASRMESSGAVGKVNISEATYELLKDDVQFSFESRGKIEAKGKGEMEMYFVNV